MENRTVGILVTAAAALVCGCTGLFSLIFGTLGALQVPFQTTVNGVQGSTQLPSTVAYVLLCLSLLLFAIPVVVGFLALRHKTAPAKTAETIPPAS